MYWLSWIQIELENDYEAMQDFIIDNSSNYEITEEEIMFFILEQNGNAYYQEFLKYDSISEEYVSL